MLTSSIEPIYLHVTFFIQWKAAYKAQHQSKSSNSRLDLAHYDPLHLSNLSSRKVNYILKMTEMIFIQDKIYKDLMINQPMCLMDFKNIESSPKSTKRALRSLTRIGFIKCVFKAHGANYYALYNWKGGNNEFN